MTTFVIEHDGARITGWRYEVADDYAAGEGELLAPAGVHHNNVERYTLDTSGSEPAVVEDPDFDPRSDLERLQDRVDSQQADVSTVEADLASLLDADPVRRGQLSAMHKQAFAQARANDDVQGQLDALYELLTGETPGG